MKIAVTGASGYLGSNFISMYKDEHEFVAITRDAASVKHMKGIDYRESDYSIDSLMEIFRGCDAAVHLAYAMATKENEQRGADSYRSSISATKNVLAAARRLGIKNVVFASSRLVYANRSEEPFRETSMTEPATYYGKSKLMAEQLCQQLNRKGACVKMLRFGQIIGADMKVKGMFHIFMDRAAKNEPLTLIGSDIRDYIYVKDACRAIGAALRHPAESGAFNISMGRGTDNRAMAEAIISASGSSSEILIKETDSAKIPDRIVLDCTKAERELGFSCSFDSIYKIAADVLQMGQPAVGV